MSDRNVTPARTPKSSPSAPRESQSSTADEAMNPTGIGPRLLTAAFMLMIGALAVSAAWRFADAGPQHGDRGWFDGKASKAFESLYDAQFPVKTFGVNLWAAIELSLFGEGRHGVIVGQNGWLYTDEEFRDHADARETLSAHLDEIARTQATLAQHQTTLLVALVPAKARIYPEHIGERRPALLHRHLYPELRAALLDRGVTTPDLLDALETCKQRAAVFLRTDTHWTPAGAACAAQTLSAAVRRVDRATPATQPYVTETDPALEHRGDLMRFLPVDPYFASLLPRPDALAVTHTTRADGGGLLDEAADPDVVLVGTSYSADTRWNFVGALQQTLSEDVLNVADPGQGPFVPMRAYLEQLRAGAKAPRVLIWEIPERYMPAADPETPARGAHKAAL